MAMIILLCILSIICILIAIGGDDTGGAMLFFLAFAFIAAAKIDNRVEENNLRKAETVAESICQDCSCHDEPTMVD